MTRHLEIGCNPQKGQCKSRIFWHWMRKVENFFLIKQKLIERSYEACQWWPEIDKIAIDPVKRKNASWATHWNNSNKIARGFLTIDSFIKEYIESCQMIRIWNLYSRPELTALTTQALVTSSNLLGMTHTESGNSVSV